jgi:imidazolonepropionase-like amidohydrolase
MASVRGVEQLGERALLPQLPHDGELELMVKYGMEPHKALQAVTRQAARLLGVSDESGTIEPGKRADLVFVQGDPLEFATPADRITAVYKGGVAVV